MEPFDITENELIELLVNQLQLDEQQANDGFMTMREIATAAGWTMAKTQKKMRGLFEQGLIESRNIPRMNMAGRLSKVPAYRVIQGD
jgi:hypothetical protein